MRVNALRATLLGLSTLLVDCSGISAQEPREAAAPKANEPDAGARSEAVDKEVDLLVDQLRRYPARPSTAAGQIGLFLIDADGGEATLIANEPDPWLNKCGSPVWSHDGKQILFHASNEGVSFGSEPSLISRLKALHLADGRLEIRDLGPGSSPDRSPSDDRLILLLRPGSLPGADTGVWLMNADGSGRRFLGGNGQPLWSPDGHQFLIVGRDDPREVTVIDDRPGHKSGLLKIADLKVFSAPKWAGAGTIVAVIGEEIGDTVALIDVSELDQAKVKEVLWRQGKDLDVKPSYPVYSPGTRRCVFVGEDPSKGKVLFALQHGRPGTPKRLEPQGFDKTIQDLAFSPDGRFVVFASDRRQSARGGFRPQSVDAPALSGITIDGDLGDWPAAMPRYPIQNMHAFPVSTGRGRREQAFLSTSPDLSAAFSVGYDPKEQVLYLAVIVRDDQLIIGNGTWDTDAMEVYVDGQHSETVRGLREAPVLQYVGVPGKALVYGLKESSGLERGGEGNPILVSGDIHKTKTRMAFRRRGDVTTYEWAVQAFDHYPDKPTRLLPGVQIGFEVAVVDKDKPAQTPLGQNDPEEDRQAWVCWGPAWKMMKVYDPSSLGEIILGRAPSP